MNSMMLNKDLKNFEEISTFDDKPILVPELLKIGSFRSTNAFSGSIKSLNTGSKNNLA
jgi:hypothetical protein